MRFARWVDQKGSTDFNDGGEKFGTEGMFDEARSHYEVFISNCLIQLEEAILATVSDDEFGPVEQALVLSSIATILGSRMNPSGLENLEAFIDYKSERQNLISGSSGIRNPINQLQELSRLVLHRLFDGDNADVSFAEVFRSARTGTGEPIFVDVYGLRELAIETWNKPVELLEKIVGKDLEYVVLPPWRNLREELYDAAMKIDWEKELNDIREQLNDVLKFVEDEDELNNLGKLLLETMRSLNQSSNLRPVHIFEDFDSALERLRASLLVPERVQELEAVRVHLQSGGKDKLFDSLYVLEELVQHKTTLNLLKIPFRSSKTI